MSAEPARKKQKIPKAKVSKACVFCRRSHMSCDDERPCARCIKREIGHLCTDDRPPSERPQRRPSDDPDTVPAPVQSHPQPEASTSSTLDPGQPNSDALSSAPQLSDSSLYGERQAGANPDSTYYNMFFSNPQPPNSMPAPTDPFTEFFNSAFQSQSSQLNVDANNPMGNETYGPGLGDFLKSLDEPPLFSPGAAGVEGPNSGISPSFGLAALPPPTSDFSNLSAPAAAAATGSTLHPSGAPRPTSAGSALTSHHDNHSDLPPSTTQQQPPEASTSQPQQTQTASNEVHLNLRPANQNDRYLLAAADQKDGSRDERLARVIHAKFEAGLLKPYDYVAGYRRLFRWMETHMSGTSRKRTLQTISEFRPAFRAIASSLTDLDLVLIEEAFERLLLDYDRVFSTMGIPACLWRRTGEIYKGNKEFADLVGVSIDSLRDGKLAIYELLAEESAANYWEKYGSIAFNSGQKAVLTSCVLVHQTRLAQHKSRSSSSRSSRNPDGNEPASVVPREACLNCTFSFTVRRDSANIPYAIAGNFLPF